MGHEIIVSAGEDMDVNRLDASYGGGKVSVLNVAGASGDLTIKSAAGAAVLSVGAASGVATWGTKQAASA